MNKKDKEEVRELIIDALNEVVIPALDKMQEQIDTKASKADIKSLATKEDIDTRASKDDIDRLERRMIARENQADRLAEKVADHEKRITRLEKKPKLLT